MVFGVSACRSDTDAGPKPAGPDVAEANENSNRAVTSMWNHLDGLKGMIPIQAGKITKKEQLEKLGKHASGYLAALEDYRKAIEVSRGKREEVRSREDSGEGAGSIVPFLVVPAPEGEIPFTEVAYHNLRELGTVIKEQAALLDKYWGQWTWDDEKHELQHEDKRVRQHHREILIRVQAVMERLQILKTRPVDGTLR